VTNAEVIRKLETILKELAARREEIEGQLDRKDIPDEDWPDFERLVNARVSSMNQRILLIRTRLRQRRFLHDLNVKPLSNARKHAMEKALTKIQTSIQATAAVKSVLRLASEISDASTSAFNASAPESTA
jgi:hypothetical protein